MHVPRFAVPALVAGFLGSAPVAAQDEATETIQVGAAAPDFELRDASGTAWRLSELVKDGPVALEFFRSGDW